MLAFGCRTLARWRVTGDTGLRLDAGLVLAPAGVAATLTAQPSMGTSWRIGVDPRERTRLVTTGAFALARNPIFTAMAVTSLGLAAMVPNPISLAATAVLVASVQVQVRAVEDPYLIRTHGATYLMYATRTGRFWPGLGRRTTPVNGPVMR
ncbi:isoprenylcysteine carboxylmethyltransferase family protein [Micromonospora sp. NBC_01740]|uniref:methyltransferase family protein n=1 Tax=Micromonospora sp. NBC_01740 TaxID=2975986 RepID=UPI003FA36360|nr:isoprenylcysteine carboxylmethyltransferase family protein [Micromonospora sp. NBC_01740]